MATLRSVRRVKEGTGLGIFLICFGLVFLVGGAFVLPKAIASAGTGSSAFLGLIGMFLFGLFLVWFGISQAVLYTEFGKPEAYTIPDEVSPGEEFTFTYKLPVKRNADVRSADVFLVYRERVTIPRQGSSGRYTDIKDVDRLVQSYTEPGGSYRAGQAIDSEHKFTIPLKEMGVQNSYQNRVACSLQVFWVIKLHLRLKKNEIWNEYALNMALQPFREAVPSDASSTDLYDLFLTDVTPGRTLKIMQTLGEVLPHLDSGQVGDLYFQRPALLREDLSEADAARIKEKLEASGAVVQVSPTS